MATAYHHPLSPASTHEMPTSKHIIPTEESDSDIPAWDTTPLTTSKWLTALEEYLERVDPNFLPWWEQGCGMAKQLVATLTPTHSVVLRDGAVRIHTFEDPVTIDIFVDTGVPRGTRALSATDEKRLIVAPEFCRVIDR